jgi:hypothetical protein
MIGVMEKTLSDTLHARFKRDRFYAGFRIFKTLLSTPETITPVLPGPDLVIEGWV